MSRRLVLAIDLADDPALVADYEAWHRPGGPPAAVLRAIRAAGVLDMEIFRAGARMVMVMDVADGVSLAGKASRDAADPDVVAWEARMRRYQRPIPAAGADGGWCAMTRIFSLGEQPGGDPEDVSATDAGATVRPGKAADREEAGAG